MFKLKDGRNYLFQWDLNRQVIVDDPTITEVHFCNRLDDCSLVVEVKEGLANVPNILLQNGFGIRVYAYDGEATLFEEIFEVKSRTKPSDYVYTETEIKSYEALKRRIDEIEEKGISEETVTNAVENYLAENPIDLTGYATEEYVNEAVENVSVDLSGYAKESYVDEAITQSVSGLATETYVKNAIAEAELSDKEVDLTGLATKDDLKTKADKVHIHSYNDLTDKPEIPSIVGLATESYVNEAVSNVEVDLTDYATKTYVSEEIAKAVTSGEIDLTGYAKLEDIPDVSDFISEIPAEYITETELNAKGYATEQYVADAIANIELPEGSGEGGQTLYTHHINLASICVKSSNHNSNDSVNVLIINTSANAFTLEAFKTFLTNKGCTSKENYFPATGGIVLNRYDASNIEEDEETPSEVIGIICENSYLSTVFNDPTATGNLVSSRLSESTDTNYSFHFGDKVLKIGAAAVIGGETDLSGYAALDAGDNIGNDQTFTGYNKFNNRIKVGEGILDQTSLTLAQPADMPVTGNAKAVITASQIRIYPTGTEGSPTYTLSLPDETGTLTTKEYVTEAINNIDIPDVDLNNYYNKEEVDALIPEVSDFITEIPAEYVTESELDAKGYLTEHQSLEGLATEAYVDEAIANIDIPSGGSGGSTEGAVSYLEAQELTATQKNTAKSNLELPYIEYVSTDVPDVVNKSISMHTGAGRKFVSGTFTPLFSLPAGGTFKVTLADATENPSITETIECVIKSTSSNYIYYNVLTDTSDFIIFDGSITEVTIAKSTFYFNQKNISGKGLPDTCYITITYDQPVYNNVLTAKLVDADILTKAIVNLPETSNPTISLQPVTQYYPAQSAPLTIGVNNTNKQSYIIGGYNSSDSNSKGYIIGIYNTLTTSNFTVTGRENDARYNTTYGLAAGMYSTGNTLKHNEYSSSKTYNAGDIVSKYYSSQLFWYRCLVDGTTSSNPVPSGAKSNTNWEYISEGYEGMNLFVLGNGINESTRSNALTVDWSGNVVAAGTVSPMGADYAEYFEFEDGNPEAEDRMGYLVELVGNKIRFATGTDILGATSGTKGVIGDSEEMNWHGKYINDEFGRPVYEYVEISKEPELREGKNGLEFVEVTEVVKTRKISENYDPNRPYTPRSARKEWYPVGLLGKVLVRHDGTATVGNYIKALNGIATKSEERTNIRVLEVVSDRVIKVLIK